MAINCVIDKGKTQCKLSYKLFEEEYGYDPFLDIYTYPTLIHLKDFLGGIHHCVAVIVKWVFCSNFNFSFPLTQENLDYCCINDDFKKLMNSYKGVFKDIGFFPKDNHTCVL